MGYESVARQFPPISLVCNGSVLLVPSSLVFKPGPGSCHCVYKEHADHPNL